MQARVTRRRTGTASRGRPRRPACWPQPPTTCRSNHYSRCWRYPRRRGRTSRAGTPSRWSAPRHRAAPRHPPRARRGCGRSRLPPGRGPPPRRSAAAAPCVGPASAGWSAGPGGSVPRRRSTPSGTARPGWWEVAGLDRDSLRPGCSVPGPSPGPLPRRHGAGASHTAARSTGGVSRSPPRPCPDGGARSFPAGFGGVTFLLMDAQSGTQLGVAGGRPLQRAGTAGGGR